MQKKQFGTFSLFILLLTGFLDWTSIGLVYPMFSSMLFHPDMTFLPIGSHDVVRGTWLGILLASGPLAQFFSSPIIGTLSDQEGRKPLLKQSLFIIIFGYFLCSVGVWVQSLVLLLIGRVIVGFGTGNVAVVYAALVDISKPEDRAKYFGLASMAGGMGFTVGPFLGGVLSNWGFMLPFLFAGSLSLFNLFLVIFWFKETHHIRRKIKLSLSLGLKNLKKAMQIPNIQAVLLCFFCFCVGWSFYWEFIPVTWIQEFQLSSSDVGGFFAYGAAFYALSSGLLIRPIVKRFRPLPVLFVSLILLSIAIFVLLIHSSILLFWIYIPIQQFLIALLFPTGQTIVSTSVDEDSQGEIMGVLQSVDSFAFAVSPLLAGVLVGLNAHTPIIISGAAMFLAAVVLFAGYRQRIFKL